MASCGLVRSWCAAAGQPWSESPGYRLPSQEADFVNSIGAQLPARAMRCGGCYTARRERHSGLSKDFRRFLRVSSEEQRASHNAAANIVPERSSLTQTDLTSCKYTFEVGSAAESSDVSYP